MRVILEILSGSMVGRKVLLRPPMMLTVGRTALADLSVSNDLRMSSVHFQLECEPDACLLRDLDSRNGTAVNGQPIVHHALADGDTILAGQTSFLVRIEDGPRASKAQLASVPVASESLPDANEMVGDSSSIVPATSSALQEEDPVVRREALYAAVWTRQPWLIDYCRKAALAPAAENFDACYLLGILGGPPDVELILRAGRHAALGPQRFEILGAYGHPQTMPDILNGLISDSPHEAVAAAAAFSRLTGVEIESKQPADAHAEQVSQPSQADQHSAEDETPLPDAAGALACWRRLKDSLSRASRICRGHDISRGVSDDIFTQLDMQSRWEIRLRGKYQGTWSGRLAELEQQILN